MEAAHDEPSSELVGSLPSLVKFIKDSFQMNIFPQFKRGAKFEKENAKKPLLVSLWCGDTKEFTGLGATDPFPHYIVRLAKIGEMPRYHLAKVSNAMGNNAAIDCGVANTASTQTALP